MILFDVALFVQKKHDPGGRAGGLRWTKSWRAVLEKDNNFFETKIFFDAALSCFCRHETHFLCNITFFCWHEIFFAQRQLVFVDTILLFVQSQTFLFWHKIVFRATPNFCFGHCLECLVFLSRINKNIITFQKKNNCFFCIINFSRSVLTLHIDNMLIFFVGDLEIKNV